DLHPFSTLFSQSVMFIPEWTHRRFPDRMIMDSQGCQPRIRCLPYEQPPFTSREAIWKTILSAEFPLKLITKGGSGVCKAGTHRRHRRLRAGRVVQPDTTGRRCGT